MTALAWRPSWQSLLANGTVNKPANNSLTGIVYGESVFFVHVELADGPAGDYYFIQAGNALLDMGLAACRYD